nr:EOG090X0FJX [Cyclestheria hislopi]
MENSDFELEDELRKLTIEQDFSSRSERDSKLAELIAQCVADSESSELQESDSIPKSEVPTSIIVTNLPHAVFSNQQLKREFESLFHVYEDNPAFHYLKSFRRARVDFSSPLLAAKARVELHRTSFAGETVNCYFAQPPVIHENSQQFLQIPPPVRQFLISPPSSPPVDWAPKAETEPIINLDLLAAIASLGPGEAHEVHPATESQPGIVVHICNETGGVKPRIIQTRCPERN